MAFALSRAALTAVSFKLSVTFSVTRSALTASDARAFWHFVVSGILDAMSSTDRNVDRFAGTNRDLAAVESHLRSAGNDDPMLRSLRVFLVTQTFSGQHLDAFDLESRCFFENGVGSPRPAIEFSHCRLLLRRAI